MSGIQQWHAKLGRALLDRRVADSVLGGWSKGKKADPSKMEDGAFEVLIALREAVQATHWTAMENAIAELVQVRNALDHAFTGNSPNDPTKQLSKICLRLDEHLDGTFSATLQGALQVPQALA